MQEGYAVLKDTADIDMLIKALGSTKVSVKPPTCHRTALRAQRNVNFVPLELLSVAPGQRVPITKMTHTQVTAMHKACNIDVGLYKLNAVYP